MKDFKIFTQLFVLLGALVITACSSETEEAINDITTGSNGSETIGGAEQSAAASSLNQAAYAGGVIYDYGYNSIENIPIVNAPSDTDFSRYAMLHDGETYRLYFFKEGSSDTIYQFGYNTTTERYEYGYNSIDVLTITGAPSDADTSSFAMLHDGTTYRLYLKRQGEDTTMYQFGFNPTTEDYEYGYNSIETLYLTMAPADANFDRWAMLHDGETYRHYTGKIGSSDLIYQFGFNAASSDYEYGYNSIEQLQITDMPSDSIKSNFTMLHDGSDYRFYYPSAN